ncbi:hypothetical protein RclHR1_01690007 [Rhizophagus clarus]|uniref:Uncharacterized protein n=1 Tax=Rhizophagus clarus TaxID=94130 RepID=A0A2Z6QMS2_9GLOM|nr:hypothetical protein RclHR1_01690007 [Rhizophagus clarus]GES83102.1 hypothetical protein GLOIN_2v1521125 [Rhizophagus clarus]
MSTTVRRQRRASFTTTSLIKYDNNRNNVIFGSGKNQQLSSLFVQEYQEEEEEVENCSPIEDVIRQLQNELQQTKALVAVLETRLERTEQTSQELKNLLSENESESHTTAVEIDQDLDESDDMKFDSDDDEFCISSSFIDQTLQEESSNVIIDTNDERDLTSPPILSSSQIESTTTPKSSSADDTNDSYNRICSAVQSLINDAQVALQKPDPSSLQLLGLPQTTTRPRAQSWSSNVSSWIMNQYNPSSMLCECGTCWLCLDSSGNSLTSTTRTTPKSSRANSISSSQPPSLSFLSQQESYSTHNKQVNLAGIKKQYRKKLESKSPYRKSCDDLDVALQKLISTAVSAGVEHGLMQSPVYREFMERDDSNYFRNYDDDEISDDNSFFKTFGIFCKHDQIEELESAVLNDNNDNDNGKNESSKWRRRIWNCLRKMGINFHNDKNSDNINEYVEEEEIEDGYGSYSSYSSYNSSWKSSSDYQENLNEDSSNPFPSSFTNTLNFGQNILNFNVNLINSTTNNYNKTTKNCFNEIDNSIHTTTNNYQNCYNTINNYEEKSSQLNLTTKEESTIQRQTSSKAIKSLASKFTNLLAMIGLILSFSQTIILNPTNTPALMRVAARNMIRSNVKRRRNRSDIILMIKVIKYVSVLFVGWAAGRIGKNKKKSSDGKDRIKVIPSNN